LAFKLESIYSIAQAAPKNGAQFESGQK